MRATIDHVKEVIEIGKELQALGLDHCPSAYAEEAESANDGYRGLIHNMTSAYVGQNAKRAFGDNDEALEPANAMELLSTLYDHWLGAPQNKSTTIEETIPEMNGIIKTCSSGDAKLQEQLERIVLEHWEDLKDDQAKDCFIQNSTFLKD